LSIFDFLFLKKPGRQMPTGLVASGNA